MQAIGNQLDDFYEKLTLIKSQQDTLLQENNSLKLKNNKLKEDLDRLYKEKMEIEATLTNVEQKTANSTGELDVYKQNVRKEIDTYIRKVDKCIDLVHQS